MKNILFLLLFACLWTMACTKKTPETPIVVVPPVLKPEADPVAFAAPFTGVPATKDIAMYEVNMRAFSAEGNFKGVQARLDEIKALGINVLWLMPIHPVGTVKSVGGLGSPYSIKNYREVGAEFGTLEDLQNLVKEAHNRNMAVVLDWVANHTSWDNPWITDHPEWYTKDAAGNITIPAGTNWNDVATRASFRKQRRENLAFAGSHTFLLQFQSCPSHHRHRPSPLKRLLRRIRFHRQLSVALLVGVEIQRIMQRPAAAFLRAVRRVDIAHVIPHSRE